LFNMQEKYLASRIDARQERELIRSRRISTQLRFEIVCRIAAASCDRCQNSIAKMNFYDLPAVHSPALPFQKAWRNNFNLQSGVHLKKILPVVLALSSVGLGALSSSANAEPPSWNQYARAFHRHNPAATTTATTAAPAETTTTAAAPVETTAPTTTTTTTTAPTAATGPQLDPRLTCNLPNFQQEIIDRINQARAAGRTCGTTSYAPAAALSWNGYLFNSAAGHSTDMAANNYFSHTSQDGRDPGQRITGAGYAWSAYGENIAAGQTTVQAVVDGWLNSPGHCANIMNPNYSEVGAACVASTTSQYPTYWTMDLARPY
jgi:uncharacterized protein YkwD